MAESRRSSEPEEVWSLLAQEGKRNLASAKEALLKLKQDPDDAERVEVLFRAVHSFRGGVRMMGLGVVGLLAHHAEDLIALARDDGVALQSEMIDLLLKVLDRSQAMLGQILAEGHDAEPDQAAGLIEDLQRMIVQNTPSSNSQPLHGSVAPAIQSQPVSGVRVAEPTNALTESTIETSPPAVAAGIQPNPRGTCSLTVPDDPRSVAEFLVRAGSGLGQLHAALDALAVGMPDALAQIQSMANDLKGAAERMGYQRLVAVLDELDRTTRADAQTDAPSNETAERLPRLKNVELEIFEELTHIQARTAPQETPEGNRWTDVGWLFRHWDAERVVADLARLSEIADVLDQLTGHSTVEVMVSGQSEKSAQEAMVLLKAIYYSCIFYHLDQAAHLSLTLADIYGRVAQGELIANDVLTRLTRTCVTNLSGAIDAVRAGIAPPLGEFAKLIEQAQNFMYLRTDGPVFQVTRSVLDVLRLPAAFKEVMTPEAMTKFDRALQAGERFFTVLADLERDYTLSSAFLEWSYSEGIHLITNITVHRYDRTLFNFLLATPQSRKEILAALVQMDPQWQYLTLEECVSREQVDLKAKPEEKPAQEIEAEAGATVRGGAGVSTEVIENISETLSTLVADHATMHRVVARLADQDILEAVLCIIQGAEGDGTRVHRELENYLKEWIESVYTLGQVESRVGTSLGQLRLATRTLQLAPVSDVLHPLHRTAHEPD